ncbi:hypothetical protein MUK42_33026 [Musa troglodytarum]|uniref:Uncharacterized protein n=1 Tax=Musa troglodytarum TaxID=320322 RepID=A0A9E7I431_9LILI|nr:hypothetical protein MUK42_33026 [Musa troglodytarum]
MMGVLKASQSYVYWLSATALHPVHQIIVCSSDVEGVAITRVNPIDYLTQQKLRSSPKGTQQHPQGVHLCFGLRGKS